ncbi:DUF503 domain-containing protein [Planococcus shenhongbingii]|uniref:DUF503 domain-containing protein n=1 Tax=Planococcus shenhongbingii TaxID=3058398 RepID=A0ABT8N8W1_9BACL|nr:MULTISPECIES: DUF503 domain-containing protein [unclassified Planococcus (in: firmicutes)]MDN7244178.1 DUF503 domain-containing protein [Planococcus sp. N017]WKA57353.1 DUF503 domain-containing protein [Planococcus sp. N016]
MILYMECEFFIPVSHSLKEKRAVLKSMLTRTKQKFNVSAAEIDHQNVWQRTRIAFVTVSSSKEMVDKEMAQVLQYLESNPAWECLEVQQEYL